MATSGSNPSMGKDRPSDSPSPPEKSRARRDILIVEDNKSDVFLMREAMEAAGIDPELHVVPDGERAIQYFVQVDDDESLPCPDLVLIDINLPRKHGDEVLRALRASRRSSKARVLVVTSSDSLQDREQMLKLGANGYFRKPSQYDAYLKRWALAIEWHGRAVTQLESHEIGRAHV